MLQPTILCIVLKNTLVLCPYVLLTNQFNDLIPDLRSLSLALSSTRAKSTSGARAASASRWSRPSRSLPDKVRAEQESIICQPNSFSKIRWRRHFWSRLQFIRRQNDYFWHSKDLYMFYITKLCKYNGALNLWKGQKVSLGDVDTGRDAIFFSLATSPRQSRLD